MNIEAIRNYCLAKKGASESTPFGPDTLVFKVGGKIFLLLSLDEIPSRINLKCEPETALELREKFDAVLPGYHQNKKHWNTIVLDGSVSDKLIIEWIDDSYELVFKKLPIKQKLSLENG